MKNKLYIIFICSLLSIGFHLYLNSRSYSLATDKVSGPTICYISDSVNCDNVLTSNYSEFAGIPISNWGGATHLIIAFLSLCLLIGWTEKPSLLLSILNYFAFLSAGASLVMLGISGLVLHLFCPVCIILYLLSFIVVACVLPSVKQAFSLSSLKTIRLLLPSFFIVWVLIGVLLHLMFINTYNVKSITQTVKFNVMDWASAPVKKNKEEALLTTGPSNEEALITITEFADFLCSHCRNSHYILKIFKASNPQVRIEYFSFPLDQCKSKRASCALTRAVYCAEKQNQGWNMHGLIFEHQKKFIVLMDNRKAIQKIKEFSSHLPLHWDNWSKCIKSPSAFKMQEKQIKAGDNMEVMGTPSLFVNGKKLHHQYFTKTIQAIRKYLKEKKLPCR